MAASDLLLSRGRGTLLSLWRIATVQIKDVSGVLQTRDNTDGAFVNIESGGITAGTVGSPQPSTFNATTFQVASQGANNSFIDNNSTGVIEIGSQSGGTVGTGTGTIAVGVRNDRQILVGNTSINTGSVKIDTGTGNIDIGTGAQGRTVNLATGAAVQTLTAGSTTLGSVTTINAGASGSGGTLNLANTSTASIQMATGAQTQTVNLGTGAGQKTVTLGSFNGASSTQIDAGSGNMSIANNGSPTVNMGTSANGQSINLGTGGGPKIVAVGSTNSTSSMTIDAGTGGINIGTSAAARATNIATGAGVQTVTVGSTNSTSSMTIDAGTAGINIGTSNAVRTTNIVTGTGIQTVNLATGAADNVVTIGSLNAGATLTLQAGNITIIDSPLTRLTGDLAVLGTTTTINSTNVLVKDRFIYENADNVTPGGMTAGLAVNYSPTATASAVAGAGFPTLSTVEVAAGTALVATDIIQIVNVLPSVINNGLYVVASVSPGTGTGGADVITIDTGSTNPWAQNTFETAPSAGLGGDVRKVGVSVIQSASTGFWEQGAGNTAPLSFTPFATSAGATSDIEFTVPFTTAVGGMVDSTTSVASGASPIAVEFQVTTAYDGAATVSVGNAAGTANFLMTTADIVPGTLGIYKVDLANLSWSATGAVRVTIAAVAATVGAGWCRLVYATTPNP
jgi:hypothetical protein